MAVIEPARHYEVPLLGDLLEAALAGVHLKVVYDAIRSGISEQVIYPFGVYASQGSGTASATTTGGRRSSL